DFWFDMFVCVETRGNAYIQKVKVAGEVLALYVIDPDIVQVHRDSPGARKTFAISGRDGRVDLTAADVLHIRGPSLKGGDVGQTPLRMAADTMHAALAAQLHEAHMYENGGAVPYAVTFEKDKTDEQ